MCGWFVKIFQVDKILVHKCLKIFHLNLNIEPKSILRDNKYGIIYLGWGFTFNVKIYFKSFHNLQNCSIHFSSIHSMRMIVKFKVWVHKSDICMVLFLLQIKHFTFNELNALDRNVVMMNMLY